MAEEGDDTPIAWVHRRDRYGEKLATPDTSIADLIGEVDPIKVAEGRYLSDELTLHYGLVPRVNRGIFAINELPDLAERIQVGPAQRARGARRADPRPPGPPARSTSCWWPRPTPRTTPTGAGSSPRSRTASAPRSAPTTRPTPTTELADHASPEAEPARRRGRPRSRCPTSWPRWWPRSASWPGSSPHLNQRAGVSVRLTIANYETLVANAVRRALRIGEPEAVPRVSDLAALVSSTQGKIEIEALEEGREDEVVLAQLVAAAVLAVFRRRVTLDRPAGRRRTPSRRGRWCTPATTCRPPPTPAVLADMPALEPPTRALAGPERPSRRPWWPAPSSSCSRGCT